ncbi:type II toxin-antitoxin system RelE/ParE family toxin [Pseudomonas putida]|uniref:type II toxin-antitoxin system RelE/ParE family toxin n=1 Tax=Pseudomonas putida TaxID=303 RepID=UPI0023647FC6|nr:type II toxin-antitoxin system RelE/ParE family toxin [Pseudomonas putida]MDD2009926.1 type II toxin-antitoxin system RelE/ParE family toxin [Pseudomonas putida]
MDLPKQGNKDLPKDVQDDFGKDLRRIQYGQNPERPIKSLTESVGAGAIELIINGSPAFRCVAKFADMVVVLHSFIKTTNRSDRHAAGRRTADEGVEARTEKNGIQGLAARRLGDHDLGR